MSPAAIAATRSVSATAANVAGSVAVISNRSVDRRCGAARAPQIPTAIPVAPSASVRRIIIQSTLLRAERHAQSDLVGPKRHGVRQHAVRADQRQNQRKDGENTQQARLE